MNRGAIFPSPLPPPRSQVIPSFSGGANNSGYNASVGVTIPGALPGNGSLNLGGNVSGGWGGRPSVGGQIGGTWTF